MVRMHTPSMIRTSWAAIGAAVAVSRGGGGAGFLHATAPAGAAAFVAITPCRLVDTRPAPQTVGTRTTPLGPDETYAIAARGAQGNCALPGTAVGLVLNVTAVAATQATFLTLFPTGVTRPIASHVNPVPGAPPAPNAVTVDLSDDGRFAIFNRFGSVHVIADVVGYYTDHHHDDRYYTEAEVDALIATPPALPYRPHIIDLVPEAPTYWGYEDGWVHYADSPKACLVTPLRLAAGAAFTRVTVAHDLLVLNAVDVEIVSRRSSVGAADPAEIVHFRDMSGQTVAPSGQAFGTVTFEHDPASVPPGTPTGPVPSAGYDTMLRVCADTTIRIQSIEIA